MARNQYFKRENQGKAHIAPDGTVRWTVQFASREFGCQEETLARNLAAAAMPAGADHCYSTGQVVAALYGGMNLEKLRHKRAQRRLEEIKVAERAAELVNAADVKLVWERIAQELRARLYRTANKLPGLLSVCRDEKQIEETILRQLDECLQALAGVEIELPDDDPEEPEPSGVAEESDSEE